MGPGLAAELAVGREPSQRSAPKEPQSELIQPKDTAVGGRTPVPEVGRKSITSERYVRCIYYETKQTVRLFHLTLAPSTWEFLCHCDTRETVVLPSLEREP